MPDTFTVGNVRAVLIPATSVDQKQILNARGGTLYHKTASDVSASSNDGSLSAGGSTTASAATWVIGSADTVVIVNPTPAVSATDLTATDDATVTDDLTVGDALAVTGASTLTGGIAQATAAHGFANWHPPTATSGTDTAFADGTQFVTSLFLPVNKTITNINYLIGSVGGTDKVYGVIYDADGTNVANTAVTAGGATVGTAANIQTIALTATYAAKGPRLYYVGISANGATAKLRTVPAFTSGGIFAGSVSQTHGTVAAITEPTTFTADKAPVVFLN